METFPVAGGGAWDGLEVVYSVGSRTYLLEVGWRLVVCGEAVAGDEACEGFAG